MKDIIIATYIGQAIGILIVSSFLRFIIDEHTISLWFGMGIGAAVAFFNVTLIKKGKNADKIY